MEITIKPLTLFDDEGTGYPASIEVGIENGEAFIYKIDCELEKEKRSFPEEEINGAIHEAFRELERINYVL